MLEVLVMRDKKQKQKNVFSILKSTFNTICKIFSGVKFGENF